MVGTSQVGRVVIIVKALPRPSKLYGETVCCAGVTADRQWKRLFPIRFRQLKGESSFARWQWVKFTYGKPKSDVRPESCHVHEESIAVDGSLPRRERGRLINPMILGSAADAQQRGYSLAFIRPRNTKFLYKHKSSSEIEAEREAFRVAARQTAMFDKELAELEPTPFKFQFKFEDDGGSHTYENGDWEAHAMFWRERNRTNEIAALKWMDRTFNEEYPARGMVFAVGNQAKRPHTWQLLGVVRVDDIDQGELPL